MLGGGLGAKSGKWSDARYEINVQGGESFLVFGDSDQDGYVMEIDSGMCQIKDKQAFDNAYEEFQDFDSILVFVWDMILRRIE